MARLAFLISFILTSVQWCHAGEKTFPVPESRQLRLSFLSMSKTLLAMSEEALNSEEGYESISNLLEFSLEGSQPPKEIKKRLRVMRNLWNARDSQDPDVLASWADGILKDLAVLVSYPFFAKADQLERQDFADLAQRVLAAQGSSEEILHRLQDVIEMGDHISESQPELIKAFSSEIQNAFDLKLYDPFSGATSGNRRFPVQFEKKEISWSELKSRAEKNLMIDSASRELSLSGEVYFAHNDRWGVEVRVFHDSNASQLWTGEVRQAVREMIGRPWMGRYARSVLTMGLILSSEDPIRDPIFRGEPLLLNAQGMKPVETYMHHLALKSFCEEDL